MMDSFELNKLIGAFLAVVFVVFSVSLVSDAVFSTHAPETPGYAIEVPETDEGGGEVVEEGPSIAELLQTADPAAGESAFRKCAACHTAEEGGANKVGPNLWDIVNRPVASHEGFSYSAAMREFAQDGSVVWDFEHLSEFLKAPRSYIPNTAMAFAGLRNPEEEANLLAYLRTLSADPAPLPEVEEAAAPADEEGAPAEEGAAPAEEGAEEATPPADEAAPPAEDAPAPAEEGAEEATPPADEATPPAEEAPAPADEGGESDAEPAQPDTTDDGSSAAPEPDAGAETAEPPVEEE